MTTTDNWSEASIPNVEAFIEILDRYILDFNDGHTGDYRATAAAILNEMDAAGWLTTPHRVAAIEKEYGDAYGRARIEQGWSS